ncbi:hypothetical protein LCGC14_2543070, partial [marine sediment metagenome]
RPRRVLDADLDGWRWLRSYADKYESTRSLTEAGKILLGWAKEKDGGSVLIDPYAFGWQQVMNQVMDDKDRDPKTDTHRAWGPAKRAVRVNLHFPILTAKANGIHVGLTAHTKPDVKRQGGKVIDEGLKADCDAAINDYLDLWLRVVRSKVTAGFRFVEIVKCRPQANFKPLLAGKIEIPEFESHLLYGRLLDMVGALPETAATADGDEDKDAQNAMRLASQTYSKQ